MPHVFQLLLPPDFCISRQAPKPLTPSSLEKLIYCCSSPLSAVIVGGCEISGFWFPRVPCTATGSSPKLQSGFCWENSGMLTAPPSPEFVHLFAALCVRKSAGNRGRN
ncbi:hypothetical protein SLEP1_g22332 [Rubroshorea leprosula]|uniref:Uncharacterized protein n=1 Tax=Rubroshorea leprosula TaxID=152421 RepID=A0AAV5JE75_9ROSI|nr:hypothetical protein SLEP1_g22332 [Rubroshorea leprosula]